MPDPRIRRDRRLEAIRLGQGQEEQSSGLRVTEEGV